MSLFLFGEGKRNMEDERTEKKMREKIKFVREFAPGFVGGKDVAKEATDEEIWHLILLNKIAGLVNSPDGLEQKGERMLILSLTELEETRKSILTSIRSRLT